MPVASDDIQKAFAQAFEGIDQLITAQIDEARSQELTVSVGPSSSKTGLA